MKMTTNAVRTWLGSGSGSGSGLGVGVGVGVGIGVGVGVGSMPVCYVAVAELPPMTCSPDRPGRVRRRRRGMGVRRGLMLMLRG